MKKLLSLCVLTTLSPALSFAQEAEPGGVFYTFDFGQRFEANTDTDLTTPEDDSAFEGITSFSFGAVTETRSQRLSFNLGTDVRVGDGDVSSDDTTARLAYSRNSADALFDISIETARSDISFLRDTEDFIGPDGELELPDDFDDLSAEGIRNVSSIATSLTWGETNPIGFEVNLRGELLLYTDAGADLADTDSFFAGAGMRLNINEVTEGNIRLSYESADEVGMSLEEDITLDGALTFARPLGDLTTRLGVTRDEEDDIFWSGAVEREYELANASLSGSIGFAQDDDREARPTARIAYTLPIRPISQIELSAVHTIDPGGDSTSTAIRANYLQEVATDSGINVGFSFAQTSDPDGADSLGIASITASYGISLNEFWQMTAGAQMNARYEDGGRTRGNLIFLALERPFSWRP